MRARIRALLQPASRGTVAIFCATVRWGKERGALHHEADLAADLDNISVSEADALNIDVAAVREYPAG